VFQLTRSAAYLGYVGFAAGIPVWLFTLFGGVLADRLPRRRLLILTQSYMMLLALVLAVLTFSGLVRAWHIVVMAFLLGAGNAFDAPARQAFVLEMVDRRTLGNAIALNSAMFNTAIAIGPAIGGLAYAAFGPGWCFTLNALSFLAVIGALAAMRLAPRQATPSGDSAMGELREGIAYVAGHPQILLLLGIVAVTSLFGMTFATLMPAWAVRILHGDARTNGLLLSARGIGALASALFLASGRNLTRGKALAYGLAGFPAALLAFAFLRRLAPALILLVGVGATSILIYNAANALVQTLADDSLRGRVMGLYSLGVLGLMPVGSLLAGNRGRAHRGAGRPDAERRGHAGLRAGGVDPVPGPAQVRLKPGARSSQLLHSPVLQEAYGIRGWAAVAGAVRERDELCGLHAAGPAGTGQPAGGGAGEHRGRGRAGAAGLLRRGPQRRVDPGAHRVAGLWPAVGAAQPKPRPPAARAHGRGQRQSPGGQAAGLLQDSRRPRRELRPGGSAGQVDVKLRSPAGLAGRRDDPPWASTIALAMERPIPAPPVARLREESTR